MKKRSRTLERKSIIENVVQAIMKQEPMSDEEVDGWTGRVTEMVNNYL